MNKKLIAGVAAGLAVAGGGAAIAATQSGDPKTENAAIVNDAAEQLGVSPAKLGDALKRALEDRVDAAVSAGRITKAEGDDLKQRIESGEAPLFAGPGDHGPGFHRAFGLDAAATYLRLDASDLRARLESGKTLAQVAEAQGKSVSGLVGALVADAKTHLDEAVSAGRLTQAQETRVLADLEQRITDFVNGVGPSRDDFRHRGFDRGFDGPDA